MLVSLHTSQTRYAISNDTLYESWPISFSYDRPSEAFVGSKESQVLCFVVPLENSSEVLVGVLQHLPDWLLLPPLTAQPFVLRRINKT